MIYFKISQTSMVQIGHVNTGWGSNLGRINCLNVSGNENLRLFRVLGEIGGDRFPALGMFSNEMVNVSSERILGAD